MNFSQLKQLLSVIEKDQPRFFRQFDTVLTSEKYTHLKQGLVEYEAEEELVQQLYGELNTGAYSKLKGRFTEQLLDVFLLSKSSNLKAYSGTVLSKYWQLTLSSIPCDARSAWCPRIRCFSTAPSKTTC